MKRGKRKFAPLKPAGVYPSAAATRAVSEGDLNQMRFSTMNTDMPWQTQERTEGFRDIHFMGKTNSRYMDAQVSRAPLLNRASCTNGAAFVPQPMEVHDMAKEEKSRNFFSAMRHQPEGVSKLPSPTKSLYASSFVPRSDDELRYSKTHSARPPNGVSVARPLSVLDHFMETRSQAQIKFSAPPELSLSKEAWNTPTTLGPVARGPMHNDAEYSLYQKDFTRSMQRPMSVPELQLAAQASSMGRTITPEPGQVQGQLDSAARLEKERRSEGRKLHQVFKDHLVAEGRLQGRAARAR